MQWDAERQGRGLHHGIRDRGAELAKGHHAVPLKLSDRKQAATCKSGEEDSK